MIPLHVKGLHMNLPQLIFKRAGEKGLLASCIKAPCGHRFWSFHVNADDLIYCSRFKTVRPRDAVINHVPEAKALWFLEAYNQELYDSLLYTGNTKPGVPRDL